MMMRKVKAKYALIMVVGMMCFDQDTEEVPHYFVDRKCTCIYSYSWCDDIGYAHLPCENPRILQCHLDLNSRPSDLAPSSLAVKAVLKTACFQLVVSCNMQLNMFTFFIIIPFLHIYNIN